MYDFDPSRIGKARQLEAEGIPPWPHGLSVSHTAQRVREETARFEVAERARLGLGAEDPVELTPMGEDFQIGGRLLFKNEMGKAGFGRVLDRTERIQIYAKRDLLGDEGFALWKKLDLGDIVWVRGALMRTRTGELTVQAREIRLGSKCTRSLPDKFHGMSDPEARQRQRYVDLFVNEESRAVFLTRSWVVSYIRRFFEERGFVEVETPMMHAIPGGATARPFITHHNALDLDLYLRVAPELYLKRLVVGGMERVFEINRNFRNEGIDQTHNPEFTMLEFYQAWQTWEGLMEMTEQLVSAMVEALHTAARESGTLREGQTPTSLLYGDLVLDFGGRWARRTYAELVYDQLRGVGYAAEQPLTELADVHDLAKVTAAYKDKHRQFNEENIPVTLGRFWEKVFDMDVEKTLLAPTFVTGFPIEISPLARRSDADPTIADRFELFIAGREIANGFNELNDPEDQARRFEEQVRAKAGGDAEAMHFDADYIDALGFGLPPTAGEGLGIDRLVMLLTNCKSIRDVILFPTRRPVANSVEPDAV
ncbi:MAG: lysine--tRNA ligase [Myxococcales bacterium]|nr:lysine--tRNA ligase [Myxococcales bacterium]